MAVDASAYATLGLRPDAEWVAVEAAYKRLIKLHHPDRPGGSVGEAAEINRAYREIRSERSLSGSLEMHPDDAPPTNASRSFLAAALILAVGSLGLLFLQAPIGRIGNKAPAATRASLPARSPQAASADRGDPMNQPLDLIAIDQAADEAQRLSRTRDEMVLASTSRDCHHMLHTSPTIALLDRCAAFDDAVVMLQDRDPMRDQGPFSEIAVTGRLWSSAAALSDDSLATDARFDRVRMRVRSVLTSTPTGAAPPPAN